VLPGLDHETPHQLLVLNPAVVTTLSGSFGRLRVSLPDLLMLAAGYNGTLIVVAGMSAVTQLQQRRATKQETWLKRSSSVDRISNPLSLSALMPCAGF